MKKILLVIFIFFISISNVLAAPMAHNIYSNPDTSKGSGKYSTFMIDFKGIRTPNQTYWSLCNWQLDLTSFKKNHYNVNGGSAYAGLQVVDNKRKAIMSFWEISYNNSKNDKTKRILRAKMIYPYSGTNSFGGEGEGSNYITNFNWKTNNWYKMVIHAWEDIETKKTFVGQWFLDLSSNKWYLISYFNTNLTNSGLTGDLSLFQENFVASTAKEYREFNFKNMYARNYYNKNWISLNTATLTYDTEEYGYNTAGTHEFGVKNNVFYGKAGGTVKNQKEYDSKMPKSLKLSISQPTLPQISTGKPTISIKETNKKTKINWNFNGPQEKFTISIIDTKTNKVIYSVTRTRPEIRSITINKKISLDYKYQLTVTDIFGTVKTINYIPTEKDIVIEKEKKSNSNSNEKQSNSNSNNLSNTSNDISNIVEENNVSNNTEDKNPFTVDINEDKKYKNNNILYIVIGIVIFITIGSYCIHKKRKN